MDEHKNKSSKNGQESEEPNRVVSRRDLLGSAAAGVAAGALATAGLSAAFAANGPPPDAKGPERILLKGGTVITMDPAVPNLANGDVLIEGKKIVAIGPNLSVGGGQVIDCTGMIMIPGFCDPHIHSWQGQIPRLIANQSVPVATPTNNYTTVYHNTFAPAYRPEDMYIGTLMTMLVAIDGGITTVCDNSHNSRSSEHSDAAIEALFDSGIRGVHASGVPSFGVWDH